MTPEEAILKERKRCADLVRRWHEFEWREGGVRFCIGCSQAGEIAKAIDDPTYTAVVEKAWTDYMAQKRLHLEIR